MNGPVRKPLHITQMPEVVNVAKELILQLGIVDGGNGAVLVECARVALQPRTKVGNVRGNLLNHQPAHLRAPDGLGCVELAEKNLGKLVGPVVFQVANHGVRQDRAEHTALHQRRRLGFFAAEGLLGVRVVKEAADREHVRAGVHHGEEKGAREVESWQHRVVLHHQE